MPENQVSEPRFSKCARDAGGIEGMLSEFSIAVMDMMLSLQGQWRISGQLVEFGVYRGRSAAVLANHARAGERLVLVDPVDLIELERLRAIHPATEVVIAAADDFPRLVHGYRSLEANCRVVHVDASHQFEPTQRELAIADKLLAADGLIILDDYTNLNYSQNIAAIFKYLFTKPTSLTPVLVTEEKAYLCHRAAFQRYARFLIERAGEEMSARGIDACLARTDLTAEYGAFFLRPRMPGEIGPFYGFEIYKDYYRAGSGLPEAPDPGSSLAARAVRSAVRRLRALTRSALG